VFALPQLRTTETAEKMGLTHLIDYTDPKSRINSLSIQSAGWRRLIAQQGASDWQTGRQAQAHDPRNPEGFVHLHASASSRVIRTSELQ
jgi:hypothetical protein